MSRVIGMRQYDTLAALRGKVHAAIAASSAEETHRSIGMVQGYLIGLHVSGEIDAFDVKSLEEETLANVNFMLNARKAGRTQIGGSPLPASRPPSPACGRGVGGEGKPRSPMPQSVKTAINKGGSNDGNS